MLFNRTLQERLNLWFNQTYLKDETIQYSNYSIKIEESTKDGQALVEFHPYGKYAFFIKGENAHSGYLKEGLAVADSIIFIIEEENEEKIIASLHIIEIKKSIDFNEWKHIKFQFSGALIRALAIKGILELTVKGVYFYTAYQNSSLETRPALSQHQNKVMQNEDLKEWVTDIISLKGISHKFKHTKIKLDKNGFGEINLTI